MPIRSTTPLSGLFRRSPFKPIQEHMRIVFSCICLVPPLFDALYVKDQQQIKELSKQIDELETAADKVKSTFRLNMPTSLLMPVDRKDLLGLISDQDSIADTAESISQIVSFRDMDVPEGIKALLDELLEGTMEITSDAKDMIEQLDELLEVGFGGREFDKVNAMIAGVRRSEHNIDTILHRARRALFSIESELDPVSVMFWYKILELLGNISDQSENMADRLLLFLSK
ncbi:TIGR00153 family protein [Desulfosediminicola flagellatus]|uniref:TIGR00153 family protein n=1 Tax=Desulfosediminicola flagellatus TaxID=2569541 RepID=UPI0010AD6787|nr:TIGR00153 family protein [Desulfosediminicola flagellatus]